RDLVDAGEGEAAEHGGRFERFVDGVDERRPALLAQCRKYFVAAGERSGVRKRRALSSVAAAKLEHDDGLRTRRTRERRTETRPVLDAFDEADNDVSKRIVGEPFQIVRRVDHGFVAAGD